MMFALNVKMLLKKSFDEKKIGKVKKIDDFCTWCRNVDMNV